MRVLISMIFFLFGFSASAEELRAFPGWELEAREAEENVYEAPAAFLLTPTDGRESIEVDAKIAARLRAGTLKPEEVYRQAKSGKKALTAETPKGERTEEAQELVLTGPAVIGRALPAKQAKVAQGSVGAHAEAKRVSLRGEKEKKAEVKTPLGTDSSSWLVQGAAPRVKQRLMPSIGGPEPRRNFCAPHASLAEKGQLSRATFEDGTDLQKTDHPRYSRSLVQSEERRKLPMLIYPRFFDLLDPHTGLDRKVAVIDDDFGGCKPGNKTLMIRQGPIPKEYCEIAAAAVSRLKPMGILSKFSASTDADCKKKEKMEVWVLPDAITEHEFRKDKRIRPPTRAGRTVQFTQGQRRFLGFSLRLDPAYEAPKLAHHWTIHMQLHQDTTSSVSGRGQPVLTLEALPSPEPDTVRFVVRIKEEKEEMVVHALPAEGYLSLRKGEWYQLAFDLTPSTDSKVGRVRFALRGADGSVMGPYAYEGAWSYATDQAEGKNFNLSVGVYRARQQALQLFYLDDIAFGESLGSAAPWAQGILGR